MKKYGTILFLSIVMLVSSVNNSAYGFSFHAAAGPSVPTGDESDSWNTGLSIRGYGYNPITSNIQLGFGMDVNWHTLNGMGIVPVQNRNLNWDNQGDLFMIEVGPTLRFQPSGSESKSIRFFGEAGVSFFRMSQSGTIRASNGYSTGSSSFASDKNQVGATLGGGVSFGGGSTRFEILPLIHYPFDEDMYFTLTGGIVFGR
jgi:hypothetical protein